MLKRINVVLPLFIIAILLLSESGGAVRTNVDRITYVYEKDLGAPPPGVSAAILEINADKSRKIIASEIDKDIRDGLGEVPDQYKIPIATATAQGLPALVVQAGEKVVSVARPTTRDQVMEALK